MGGALLGVLGVRRPPVPRLDFQDFGQQSLVPVHGSELIVPRGDGRALAREIAAELGRERWNR